MLLLHYAVKLHISSITTKTTLFILTYFNNKTPTNVNPPHSENKKHCSRIRRTLQKSETRHKPLPTLSHYFTNTLRMLPSVPCTMFKPRWQPSMR